MLLTNEIQILVKLNIQDINKMEFDPLCSSTKEQRGRVDRKPLASEDGANNLSCLKVIN